MRISDWSSDVCSSDLFRLDARQRTRRIAAGGADQVRRQALLVVEQNLEKVLRRQALVVGAQGKRLRRLNEAARTVGVFLEIHSDRKSVVEGKSVSVRVDLGGRRSIKKKKRTDQVLRRRKKNQ